MSAMHPKATDTSLRTSCREGPIADIEPSLPALQFAGVVASNYIVRRQRTPIPLSANSPTGSTFTASSTAISTRGLIRICPGLASRKAETRHWTRPDGGVVEAPLEPDGAERRKPVRYADAEANLVPEAAPRPRQCSDCVAHFKRHQDRLERRVLYRHWIIEDHHHAVAGVAFERAAVLDDFLADCRVVVAQ